MSPSHFNMPQIVTPENWEAMLRHMLGQNWEFSNAREREDVFSAISLLLRNLVVSIDLPSNQVDIICKDRKRRRQYSQLAGSDCARVLFDLGRQLRAARVFQSCGIHFVDPIAGRISRIWVAINESSPKAYISEQEIYAHCWNKVYRRLFKPSATLINAIESGILSWRKQPALLSPASTLVYDDGALSDFVLETQDLARKLELLISKTIKSHLPRVLGKLSGKRDEERCVNGMVIEILQSLNEQFFIQQLDRLAVRFRDDLVTNDHLRDQFHELLSRFSSLESPLLKMIKAKWCLEKSEGKLVIGSEDWDSTLDVIRAIQSSILSEPKFCGEEGLWIDRLTFPNFPLQIETSCYLIFGLKGKQDNNEKLLNCVASSLTNLKDVFPRKPKEITIESNDISPIVSKIFEQVKTKNGKHYVEGLERWLCIVSKLSSAAIHEGRDISYRVAYGPLSYCQAHFRPYEKCPDTLVGPAIDVDMIVSYIKAFYSLFGNHSDRLIWFDQTGAFCGVYEDENKVGEIGAEHKKTEESIKSILRYATIERKECFNVSDWEKQLVRVKKGEIVNLKDEDTARNKALKKICVLFKGEYGHVANWFCRELTELLHEHSHGTSFVIQFPDLTAAPEWKIRKKSKFRSSIDNQRKSLAPDLLRIEAPLMSFSKLAKLAADDDLAYKVSGGKQGVPLPKEMAKILVELAQLDGGLLITLTKHDGLRLAAAQQFIPLLAKTPAKNGGIDNTASVLDIHLRKKLGLERLVNHKASLPEDASVQIDNVNTVLDLADAIIDNEKRIRDLSFLNNSGTKHHSLWGISLTTIEPCFSVVLSSDGHVRLFFDGREFTGLFKKGE